MSTTRLCPVCLNHAPVAWECPHCLRASLPRLTPHASACLPVGAESTRILRDRLARRVLERNRRIRAMLVWLGATALYLTVAIVLFAYAAGHPTPVLWFPRKP